MEDNKNIEKVHDQALPQITETEAESARNLGVWGNLEKFEGAQRMAKALSVSTMVPKDYQGNMGNCLIALDMADRLKMSPFAVMQNLYLVNGRPSWSAQFITTVINKSGRFIKPLQFEATGTGKDLSCYAWTEDQQGNIIKGTTVTMKMAEAEGWIDKKDKYGNNVSKWVTMPEQMIRYRAASFFGRLHTPDLINGVYAEDEVRSFTEPRKAHNEEIPNPFNKTPQADDLGGKTAAIEVEYTQQEETPEETQEDIFKDTPLGGY